MTSFFNISLIATSAAILSSCCAGHSNAVRIHNLSGEPVFQQITRCQYKKIPRLSHETFLIPQSTVHSFTNIPFESPYWPNRPIQIRNSKGVLHRYTGFDSENYSGPTYKKWTDPTWTCISKHYRAVLQPDMTIRFGSQIVIPEIGELDSKPRKGYY